MAVFDIRKRLIRDYRDYVERFIQTRDSRIHAHVRQLLDEGELCPEALIQADPILIYPAQGVGGDQISGVSCSVFRLKQIHELGILDYRDAAHSKS